jgi:hypothetical protein
MKPWRIAAVALVSGVAVAAVATLAEAKWGPNGCPPCTQRGLCSLTACVFDARSHVVIPLLIGLIGAVVAFLVLRRGSR